MAEPNMATLSTDGNDDTFVIFNTITLHIDNQMEILKTMQHEALTFGQNAK